MFSEMREYWSSNLEIVREADHFEILNSQKLSAVKNKQGHKLTGCLRFSKNSPPTRISFVILMGYSWKEDASQEHFRIFQNRERIICKRWIKKLNGTRWCHCPLQMSRAF